MKLKIDPMPDIRHRALLTINNTFDWMSRGHRDLAHRRKQDQAQSTKDGGTPSIEFKAEAALRGLSSQQFADLVLSKPDPTDARELKRQQLLLALDKAALPVHVDNLLEDLKAYSAKGP